jgi:DNA-directed RNA polymerase specialized sigma24 family protein
MAPALLRRTLPSEIALVSVALPYSPADDEQEAGASSALAGLLTHLDTVYGFALTLTGDAEAAAELTEDVYTSARDGLWATLGGHGLRDRLLARCVSLFVERGAPHGAEAPSAGTAGQGRPTLDALLRELPWGERAAIALVDQLQSSYVAAAAVLGVDVAALRELLHRGRAVLFTAFRAGAR